MAITLALGAVVIRLAWEIPYTITVPSLIMIIILILVTIGIHAFLTYLTVMANLKVLKSLTARIWITVMVTSGLIGGIIHFINFIPSPEGTAILSVVIATLLLMSGITTYLLILWFIWIMGKI